VRLRRQRRHLQPALASRQAQDPRKEGTPQRDLNGKRWLFVSSSTGLECRGDTRRGATDDDMLLRVAFKRPGAETDAAGVWGYCTTTHLHDSRAQQPEPRAGERPDGARQLHLVGDHVGRASPCASASLMHRLGCWTPRHLHKTQHDGGKHAGRASHSRGLLLARIRLP